MRRAFATRPDDVATASLVLQPFVLLYLVLLVLSPPTPEQHAAADPLVETAFAWLGPVGIPLVAVAVAAGWCRAVPLRRASLQRALGQAGVALALVVVGLSLGRLASGPALPAFLPPEEGARPGMLLGLGAGIIEETVVRLALLPLLALAGARIVRTHIAAAGAVFLSGAAFALLHEVGPAARSFALDHFVARALVPGAAMSAAALGVGFAFVVALHCGAHVLLPLLFT